MPKDGSLWGNTKGTACPYSQNPCVHLPPVAQRLQKKILFACILWDYLDVVNNTKLSQGMIGDVGSLVLPEWLVKT